MGTDYIDLYQTHWPDPQVPVEAVVDTMESLVKEGTDTSLGLVQRKP